MYKPAKVELQEGARACDLLPKKVRDHVVLFKSMLEPCEGTSDRRLLALKNQGRLCGQVCHLIVKK